MSANIWNSLAGYVIINIEGLCSERMLNRLIREDIEIWDISRRGGSLRMALGIGGFYKLRTIAREYPCRIHILEKHGLTVALCHMGKRYVMAFGWIAVIAALLIASRFIWFIDIEGCSSVSEQIVVQAIEDIGVRVGIRRGSIDTAEVAEQAMSADRRIAWAGAELTGVVLQVSVREADGGAAVHTQGEPCSIYAAQSGIITSITALSGKPLFNVGDAVRAGDEVITGSLGNGLYSESRGSVCAEVLHTFTYFAPWTQQFMLRSGSSERALWLELNGKTIVPSIPPYAEYDFEDEDRRQFVGILPIVLCSGRYYELTQQSGRASEQQLKDIALRGAEENMRLQMPENASIVSKQNRYGITEEGITCTIQVVSEENIARIGEVTDQ